jgi:hypothetical protein
LVYTTYTGKRDTASRLKRLFENENLKTIGKFCQFFALIIGVVINSNEKTKKYKSAITSLLKVRF